jgi:Pregnancy-associated plasma protein-A/Secretion system C-terminal sorting domain/Bacterial pre-peptidase C-terminal domain/Fibronectin type III domain
MKRVIHTLTLALFSVLIVHAQRKCASFEHLQQQLASNPQMATQLEAIEQFTRTHQNSSTIALRGTPVYNIPVVVHVLWNTSAQNISDAQIQSQIDVLNLDYQLLNSDTGLVPAPFKSVVADCRIQFCLAKRDPSGAATTGIVRKQTTKTSFSADNDNAKSNSTGGDNAWDASKYLNLWVVPDITSGGQTGVLGYAQFPGGAAATDGVVIGYKYFGNTGTAVAPFNKGRTATHEIGHWLNLHHIWGDEAACAADDLVSDTPLQGDKNFGCPSFPHTDACSGGNGVMYMNYMDYTDDACMYMFTNGQKSRMYGVLQAGGARASIATSDGCVPPSTGGCSAPASLSASSITTSSASLSWAAVSGANSYAVDYKTTASATWISLATATTATSASLSGLTTNTSYDWRVSANCASSSSTYTAAQFTTSASSSGCASNFEPNESQSAAASISTNTAVSAAISTTTDKDWFKFTLASTANLNITLTNLPGDFDLVLYNSAGTEIARSENGGTTSEAIAYNNAAAGTYYVQVFGYNGANSSTVCYNLNVGATTVTSTCPSTYDVSTNGTTSGAAQIPLNTDIKGLISPAGDLDHYKFVITTGGTITLSLTTLPGDYDLRLYNSAGTQVAISQNGGTTSESISYTAAAGIYYARVYGYNNANSSTSCYTLKVTTGTASREAGELVQHGPVKVDIYPNPAASVLNIAVSDYEGRASIRIMDVNGRLLVRQAVAKMNNTVDVQRLAKGVYFVRVITNEGNVLSQSRFVKD